MTGETDNLGLTTAYEYNGETSPGNSAGTMSLRELDGSTGGYLKKVSSDFESHTFNTYDAKGDLNNYSNSMGITGAYTTNDFSEVTNELLTSPGTFSPLNRNSSFTYDNNGNTVSKNITSNTLSRSFSYSYDLKNNLKTETELNRGITSYDYDNNDNLLKITDPSGKGMEMGYDNRDLVSFVKTGLETTADIFNFSYDGNSNILNSTDAYGNSTLYTYDGYDRMIKSIDPLGNITEIARSNQGNTITMLVARQKSVRGLFDKKLINICSQSKRI